MKQKEIIAIVIISILLLSGIGFALYTYRLPLLATIGYDTPIFCNSYEFTCCNEKEYYIQSFKLTSADALFCPLDSSKCVITVENWANLNLPKRLTIGEGNCNYHWFYKWRCDTTRITYSFPTELQPGEYVWTDIGQEANIKNKVYNLRLDFCGRSGCTVGVPVAGADQCTFHPPYDQVYTTIGTLKSGIISYNVPEGQCVLSFQSGDRFICGYKEEVCTSDADCGGHTYGNKECYARTLQTYGCRDFGTIIEEEDKLPGDIGWGSDAFKTLANTFGTRCEIIESKPVECCGDADCGGESFCDTSTFTCEQDVACTQDSDCGISTFCDYSDLKLKTPYCTILGQCSHTTKNVDCCSSQDCSAGYYCMDDYTCDTSVVPKQSCPYQCCINEELYFDRLCPDGQYCQEDNTCTKKKPDPNPFNLNWLYIFPILLTVGMTWLFGYRGYKKTGKYSAMDFLMGFIIGGVSGLVLYWILSNWLILTILGLLGGIGTIILISLLGGVPFLILLYTTIRK